MVDFKIDRFKCNWGSSGYVCIKAHTASLLFNNDLIHQDTTNNIPDPYPAGISS